jgi:hypothetical protein
VLPARRLRIVREEPLALQDRAVRDLQFIRRTMERSGAFTAVSGWAGVGMGGVALIAAWLARGADPERWVTIWLVAACVAFVLALGGLVVKARRLGEPLLRGPGRKFLLGTLPAILAGGLLTWPLLLAGAIDLLPGIWLMLYGIAVLGGGAFSVRVIPMVGAAFLVLGGVALWYPAWGGEAMTLGFGGLHLVFGAIVAWRHGG